MDAGNLGALAPQTSPFIKPDNQAVDAAQSLRQTDASIRAQAQTSAAQSGADGTVVTRYTYTVGPDGQRYATGATITTSARVSGTKNALDPLANVVSPAQALRELQRPRLGLSPSDEATVFGAPEFLAEVEGTNEGAVLARLQLSDFGVRAQEGQHFRAAAGLGQAPEYDYVTGPDGKLYAIAGSVGIQPGPASTDEEAAQDAATVARAALAATDVSAQDVAVAREAQSKAAAVYANNQRLVDDADTQRVALIG